MRGRPGLHGEDQTAAGVSGEGTSANNLVIRLVTVLLLVLMMHATQVKNIVKPGCSQDVLKAALSSMAHVTELLTIMSSPSYSGQATI